MKLPWQTEGEHPLSARLVVGGKLLPQPCLIRAYSAGRLSLQTSSPLKCHQFVEVQIAQGDSSTKAITGMVIQTQDEGAHIEAEIRFWPPDQVPG